VEFQFTNAKPIDASLFLLNNSLVNSIDHNTAFNVTLNKEGIVQS
jgi:hypothetical protein